MSTSRIWWEGKAFSPEEWISSMDGRFSTFPDWLKEWSIFLREWLSPSHHIEVQTSGSTGTAQTMLLLKSNMRLSAQSTNRYFQLGPESQFLSCLPVRFIAGKMMLVRALEAGAGLVLKEPRVNPLDEITEEFDFAALTPHQLWNAHHAGSPIHRIQTILLGGEAVSAALLQVIQSYPVRFVSSYGMTETITHVALQELHPNYEAYFRLLPGVTAGLNSEGCLFLEASWIEGRIQTTDRVEFVGSNRFRFLGRSDFIINSGGIKVNPEEWERSVKEQVSFDWLISSRPHAEKGEELVLVVGDANYQLAQAWLDMVNRYSTFGVSIKKVECWDVIPRTESGKINRTEVKNRLQNDTFSP